MPEYEGLLTRLEEEYAKVVAQRWVGSGGALKRAEQIHRDIELVEAVLLASCKELSNRAFGSRSLAFD